MNHVIVVGAQWGDEGKGKIVDWLANRADLVARFQGGHNAGHTLVIDGVTYALSLLPSGIVRAQTHNVIGNGVVVDPWALFDEIDALTAKGIAVNPQNLSISDAAPLILPLHTALDQAREHARGVKKIGTTGRGIGPAYEDKVARRALRTGDLSDGAALPKRLQDLYDHHRLLAEALGYQLPSYPALLEDLRALAPRLVPFLRSSWRVLLNATQEGKRILFEGAQGALLDIDHGTYPFVTSSNTQAGNAALGSGLGAARRGYGLGIVKAYTTRVGAGPFPTEDKGACGTRLAERGHEVGTVTGRPRRCGWFDAVLVRQTAHLGGLDAMALTKLDVLDGFEALNICTGYDLAGTYLDHLPSDPLAQEQLKPIYETVPGWQGTTAGCRNLDDLPPQARAYIDRLETLVGLPATVISTSPKREDTILRADPFAALGSAPLQSPVGSEKMR